MAVSDHLASSLAHRLGFLLTIAFVEANLELELRFAVECVVDFLFMVISRVRAEQERACTSLLHNLRPRVAREFAEAIRTVNDGIDVGHLSISQDEVAICGHS